MKKIENNFVVTGFVGKDVEIRHFTTASVARFPLAISRQEKNGEGTNRVSALMNMEAWRKNEHRDGRCQVLSGCREGGNSYGAEKEKGQEVIPALS